METPPSRCRPLPFTAIRDLQQALAPPEEGYDMDLVRRLVCGDPKKRKGLGDLSPVFKFLKMVDDGEIALDRKSPPHSGSPTSFRSIDCRSSDVLSFDSDPFRVSGSVDCADQVDMDAKNAVLADIDHAILQADDLAQPLLATSSTEGTASDSGSGDDIVLLPRGGNANSKANGATSQASRATLRASKATLQTSSPSLQTNSQTKLPAASPGMPLTSRIESLRELLPQLFHEDEETILQETLGNPQTAESGIHVFVDLSNIIVGLRDFVLQRHLTPRGALDFDAFSFVMERGRPVAKRVLYGSWPTYNSDTFNKNLVQKAKKRGYDTNMTQRVERLQNGLPPRKQAGAQKTAVAWQEQGVDEGIQFKMLLSMHFSKPQTMVLATGDGAKSAMSDGFLHMVETALEEGWKVELVAWRLSTNSKYLDDNWQLKWKNQFRFIDLEKFATLIMEIVPQAARPDSGKKGGHRFSPSPSPSRNV
jgi:hypothetical protein